MAFVRDADSEFIIRVFFIVQLSVEVDFAGCGVNFEYLESGELGKFECDFWLN